MAFKILCFVALFAVANAWSEPSLGYAHSYATPLAYTAGHYGSAHLSTYSAPVISKTISAAPLAYSSPLAHYSASLGHYHTPSVYHSPIVTKTVVSAPVVHKTIVSAPIVHKTVVSTPVIKSYSPAFHSYSAPLYSGHYDHSLYSSHLSSPVIHKSYSLGYSSYPSFGYASKYHF